jgi:hypothetical protein
MPDIPKWAAVAILLVGLGIMIGCAVPMSQTKESDKATSRYRGLIAGVVIGTLLAAGGLVMLVFGGGGGAAIPAPAGKEANLPSEKAGSAAVALSNSPLNTVNKLTQQTETQALLNKNKAENLVEHAKNAAEQTARLRSLIGMFKK